jgi:hypothetical protein
MPVERFLKEKLLTGVEGANGVLIPTMRRVSFLVPIRLDFGSRTFSPPVRATTRSFGRTKPITGRDHL